VEFGGFCSRFSGNQTTSAASLDPPESLEGYSRILFTGLNWHHFNLIIGFVTTASAAPGGFHNFDGNAGYCMAPYLDFCGGGNPMGRIERPLFNRLVPSVLEVLKARGPPGAADTGPCKKGPGSFSLARAVKERRPLVYTTMQWHCLGRLDPGRRDALETRAKRVKDAPAKMREKKDPLIERAGWLPGAVATAKRSAPMKPSANIAASPIERMRQ
jgi:hypothetical protein